MVIPHCFASLQPPPSPPPLGGVYGPELKPLLRFAAHHPTTGTDPLEATQLFETALEKRERLGAEAALLLESELGLLLLRAGKVAEAKAVVEKGKLAVEDLQVRLFSCVIFWLPVSACLLAALSYTIPPGPRPRWRPQFFFFLKKELCRLCWWRERRSGGYGCGCGVSFFVILFREGVGLVPRCGSVAAVCGFVAAVCCGQR